MQQWSPKDAPVPKIERNLDRPPARRHAVAKERIGRRGSHEQRGVDDATRRNPKLNSWHVLSKFVTPDYGPGMRINGGSRHRAVGQDHDLLGPDVVDVKDAHEMLARPHLQSFVYRDLDLFGRQERRPFWRWWAALRHLGVNHRRVGITQEPHPELDGITVRIKEALC